MKWNEKPFSWANRIAKAVLNCEVQLGRGENAMKNVLHLCTIDACEFVSGYNFNFRQQVCGIDRRISYAGFNLPARNANFVDQFPMRNDEWVTGQTSQHIDRAAFNIL